MTHMNKTSAIAEFFSEKSVFITGATGFIGKQLVEKLISSCPNIKNIYILVRPKRGHTVVERVKQLLSCPLFDPVRKTDPVFENKIKPIQGDILDPNFGINFDDEHLLIENCHIVFHSAATIKFNEALRLAIQMNVTPIRKLILLCHKMKKLQALIHVSTAYANCNRTNIGEMIYTPIIEPHKLIDASEWMDDSVFDVLTDKIIKDRPNTYTYTKSLAEYLLSEEGNNLPIAIIRPSIVGASWKEPFPGWIDNYNGLSGIYTAFGKGMLRTMLGNKNAAADLIPVDVVVNMMISIAWYTAVINQSKNIIVYHCCVNNCPLWDELARYAIQHVHENPFENPITIPDWTFTKNKFNFFIKRTVEELLPSYILDISMRLTGRKPRFVKLSDRINKAVRIVDFFSMHQWNFSNDNSLMLQNKMNAADLNLFGFETKNMNWSDYMKNYCIGIKVYLLREDLNQMVKCQKYIQKLKYLRRAIMFLIVTLIMRFCVKSTKLRNILSLFLRFVVNLRLSVQHYTVSGYSSK